MALTLSLMLLAGIAPQLVEFIRFGVFDSYQRLLPRERSTNPVTLIAIDDTSVERYGQWPWPRSRVAELLQRLASYQPAAVGVDIIFAEADRQSANALARQLPGASAALQQQLQALPDNDLLLAEALAASPTVLGVALWPDDTGNDGRAPHPPRLYGDVDPHLMAFKGELHSLRVLEDRAGHVATLEGAPERGVVRRLPTVTKRGANYWPAFSLEVLRVALQLPFVRVNSDVSGMHSVELPGVAKIPTDADGRWWIYFAPDNSDSTISAASVFDGTANGEDLTGKVLIVGFHSSGLLDQVNNPLGARRPGYEVHAQAIENILDDQLLQRPHWAPAFEMLVFLAAALAAIVAVPRVRARYSFLGLLMVLGSLSTLSFSAFAYQGLLFDFMSPGLAAITVFGAMLVLSYAESERKRQHLAADLAVQRESAARVEGELQAAMRIQLGLLPTVESVADPRLDIAARLIPARSVGGDLYDFFMLDEHRLFAAIGDVSGKGVPASLFMALAKSLTKSNALRDTTELPLVIQRAHHEIARDNPEFMFLTLFALVLDLRSGDCTYVNAGHEPALQLTNGAVEPLRGESGPPLCVIEEFAYAAAHATLQPGDALLLVTDGVTEAMDASDALFGRDRLISTFLAASGQPCAAMIESIERSVHAFARGRELPDDIAMLVIRWRG